MGETLLLCGLVLQQQLCIVEFPSGFCVYNVVPLSKKSTRERYYGCWNNKIVMDVVVFYVEVLEKRNKKAHKVHKKLYSGRLVRKVKIFFLLVFPIMWNIYLIIKYYW